MTEGYSENNKKNRKSFVIVLCMAVFDAAVILINQKIITDYFTNHIIGSCRKHDSSLHVSRIEKHVAWNSDKTREHLCAWQ